MSDTRLQGWIDELHDTSRQQWLLRLIAILAPIGAMASVALEVGRWWPFGLVVVAALSAASAFRPDSHTAAAVIALIAWHWLAIAEQVDTVWLPVTACCLLAYHSVIALTATFPIGGVVPTATLLQWLRRAAIASGATVMMWAVVVVVDRREAAGNGFLTALALAIVGAGAVAIRSHSLGKAD